MNIDRHNYEEYFILYMDNELGSDERRQVEEFVQKNPDLKEELELLLQYKMVPDTGIVFENKSQLIRQTNGSPVNLANYDEWLVMYMDKEVTTEEKLAIEQFLDQHPSIQQEFDLLKKTRLQPEHIVFTDKKSLYRKEKVVGRVMIMRWWRVAAAVLLIVALSTTAIVTFNKNSGGKADNGIVGQQSTVDSRQSTVNSQQSAVSSQQPTNQPINRSTSQPTAVQSRKSLINRSTDQPINQSIANQSTNQPVNQSTNNLPVPSNNPNLSKLQDAVAYNPNSGQNISKQPLTNDAVTNPNTDPSHLRFASNSPDDDDDANQSDGKKNKLRGLLRKVTRTFEKTTNINATDDQDRVLIGGLAIKLK